MRAVVAELRRGQQGGVVPSVEWVEPNGTGLSFRINNQQGFLNSVMTEQASMGVHNYNDWLNPGVQVGGDLG